MSLDIKKKTDYAFAIFQEEKDIFIGTSFFMGSLYTVFKQSYLSQQGNITPIFIDLIFSKFFRDEHFYDLSRAQNKFFFENFEREMSNFVIFLNETRENLCHTDLEGEEETQFDKALKGLILEEKDLHDNCLVFINPGW